MSEFLGDWGTLTFVLAGAVAGGFVNGLTGFGTGLTALPFWLQAILHSRRLLGRIASLSAPR
jgi:hypothetical protein